METINYVLTWIVIILLVIINVGLLFNYINIKKKINNILKYNKEIIDNNTCVKYSEFLRFNLNLNKEIDKLNEKFLNLTKTCKKDATLTTNLLLIAGERFKLLEKAVFGKNTTKTSKETKTKK